MPWVKHSHSRVGWPERVLVPGVADKGVMMAMAGDFIGRLYRIKREV